MINLVANAIKFTEHGGISLNLLGDHSSHWIIEVHDTGCGISAEDQGRIFEAFEQGSNRALHGEVGVGLGLSIVKHLTDLMQGEIDLHSEVGQGTTITVRLPLSVGIPVDA